MTSLAERLWAKVNKNGPVPAHRPDLGPCWLWTGAVNKNGYGSIGRGGKKGPTANMHVVAFEVQFGPVPEGKMVLHHCDVKLCARHVYAGTHARNMQDRQERGRTASGERSGVHTKPQAFPVGSARGHAKLTEEQVRSLRQEHAAGATQVALCEKYGVSSGNMSLIVRNKRWVHVQELPDESHPEPRTI